MNGVPSGEMVHVRGPVRLTEFQNESSKYRQTCMLKSTSALPSYLSKILESGRLSEIKNKDRDDQVFFGVHDSF